MDRGTKVDDSHDVSPSSFDPDEALIRKKVEAVLTTECPFKFEVCVDLTKHRRTIKYFAITVRIYGKLGSEAAVSELLAKISSAGGICESRGDVVQIYERQ